MHGVYSNTLVQLCDVLLVSRSLLALLAPALQASLDTIASQTGVLLSAAGPFAL